MTIQEALEKAKRLARERAESMPDYGREAAAPAAPAAMRKKQRVALDLVPAAKLRFDAIPFDERICEEKRILVGNDNGDRVTAVASDSYRILRTRLSHRMKAKGWTALGITSPGPGEGKSVTSVNLAISLAKEKNRNIFLVDVDLRSPSVCPYLGVMPKTEITRYFSGEVGPEALFFSIGLDNLVVAGGTAGTAQSSELLASGRLDALIGYIKGLDPESLIIMDLPPVLNTADVLVIAPYIDSVLLVAAVGQTRRESLASAVDVLAEFPLAGLVLNRSAEAVIEYYGA
jgi:protein-tyrosine kinase